MFVFPVLFVCSVLRPTSGAVVVEPLPVSFPFVPAAFSPAIDSTEICGSLHVADPLDGCAPLLNRFESNETGRANFVVFARGGCDFRDKTRHAQNSGFVAAIVYDDRPDRDLITMGGSSQGINIHAVFVSKVAGEFLKLYAPMQEGDCCIFPPSPPLPHSNTSDTNKKWRNITTHIFGSVFALLAIVALIAFAPHCCRRSSRSRTVEVSPRMVDTMTAETFPHFTFRAKGTCAICLVDYKEGEIIRVLPFLTCMLLS